LDSHEGVNIHVVGRAIKTASNEIKAAVARSATMVITTARNADDGPGEQHPFRKKERNKKSFNNNSQNREFLPATNKAKK